MLAGVVCVILCLVKSQVLLRFSNIAIARVAGNSPVVRMPAISLCLRGNFNGPRGNPMGIPWESLGIPWESLIGRFEQPGAKYFATCFCKNCGSSLPWLTQEGSNVVVPAGTLDDDPGIRPGQNIFWKSKAHWYEGTSDLRQSDEFPTRK